MTDESNFDLPSTIFRKHVLVETNRDITATIGLAQDKMKQIDLYRQIDLDPTFWSLDETVVNSIWNRDEEEIKADIVQKEWERSRLLAKLKEAERQMRFFNESRATFEAILNSFVGTLVSARKNPSAKFQDAAQNLVDVVRNLESMKIDNLELELKISSLDEKIDKLNDKIETKADNELDNVEARLAVTGIQSSMLNELLMRIMDDLKKVSVKEKELESDDPRILTQLIRESYHVNNWALNYSYPLFGFEQNCKHSDIASNVKHMGIDDYLSVIRQEEMGQIKHINTWKWKRMLKESHDTHEKIELVKKRLEKFERRKAADFVVLIPRSEVSNLHLNLRSFVHF